jgi:hypothetical protein
MSPSEKPAKLKSSKEGPSGDGVSKASLRRPARAELVWDGKYDAQGKRVAPLRVALPFQTVETVNESAQDRQKGFQFGAGFREEAWRNRLIWGDKKYVLPSLLAEFAGKVNLIYIDPPFDTGADFSFSAAVPENPDAADEEEITFTKEPSIIEQKAYRDTWGAGLNSYLQWLSETCLLLEELLDENGCMYVHLDWRTAHAAKLVLDEIFGSENFLNNVVWEYQTRHSSDRFWNRKHDDILLYKKSVSGEWTFNWRDEEVMQKLSPVTIAKYRLRDEKGPYR